MKRIDHSLNLQTSFLRPKGRVSFAQVKYEQPAGHRCFASAAPRLRHHRRGVVGQQLVISHRDYDVRDLDRYLLLSATEFRSMAATTRAADCVTKSKS